MKHPANAVVWTVSHPRISGAELCLLDDSGPLKMLRGWVVADLEGVSCHAAYQIEADRDWLTRRIRVTLDLEEERSLEIDHDGEGVWSVDRQTRPDLSECRDVDLGISPSTNTLPIRRLGLAVGAAENLDAAWVRFPELKVETLSQRYERRAESIYRYSSDSFQADLEVDERGVVIRYGDDLWQAVNR